MEVRQFDDLGYSLTTIKTDKFKTNLMFYAQQQRNIRQKKKLTRI